MIVWSLLGMHISVPHYSHAESEPFEVQPGNVHFTQFSKWFTSALDIKEKVMWGRNKGGMEKISGKNKIAAVRLAKFESQLKDFLVMWSWINYLFIQGTENCASVSSFTKRNNIIHFNVMIIKWGDVYKMSNIVPEIW